MAWSRHHCSVPGAASAGATLLMWVSVVMFGLSVFVVLCEGSWMLSELFTWFVVVVYTWAGRRVIASVSKEVIPMGQSSSQVVSCALCFRTTATTDPHDEFWHSIDRMGRQWWICPLHFPPAGASSKAMTDSWIRVIHLIELQEMLAPWDSDVRLWS